MATKALSMIVAASVALLCLAIISATAFQDRDPGNKSVVLYYFWGVGCPHCAKANLL
jgi:hypothetical protein